jgi:hypothetical protein
MTSSAAYWKFHAIQRKVLPLITLDEASELRSSLFCTAISEILAACDEPHFAQTVLQELAESAEKLAEIPPRPPVNGLSGLVATEPC